MTKVWVTTIATDGKDNSTGSEDTKLVVSDGVPIRRMAPERVTLAFCGHTVEVSRRELFEAVRRCGRLDVS